MRYCDTCGSELSPAEPFAVCTKCLFGSALASRTAAHASLNVVVPADAQLAIAPGLVSRPDFFQKYEILERIAQGGQGDIWKVWDFELRRSVAMKRLAEQALASEAAVYRFLAEAQIASQLEHPGILPILDVGIDPDGRPFYTTVLLPGTTLGDIWDRVGKRDQKEWNLNRGLELLIRVSDVMAHAHSRGVIHRDLKPANVLVGPYGDVRVIDWGSAHVLSEARKNFEKPFVPLNQAPIETARQEAIGVQTDSPLATSRAGQPITTLFMPPEVLLGQLEKLGPPTDIYSAGVMLYQLLTGRAPYSNADGSLPGPKMLRERILSGPPVSPRRLNRRVSRDLDAICRKAIAPILGERYGTMQALGDDLRASLELRPVSARRPGVLLRVHKWARRNAAVVLAGSFAVMVGSGAFFIVQGMIAERDVARQLTAMRGADLAARSGHWREALRQWQEAESAGYRDLIHLGLRRAEAWTVLSSPGRARAELDKLIKRSDLAERRGAVLLRIGELELFDRATFEQGIRHTREAQAGGLTAADQACAAGLLADSTPEALEWFQQALKIDSYHHSAHRHSLGLSFLLGRHQELESRIRIFKVLFPDDPSAGFLEAAELAIDGRIEEAQSLLSHLRTEATDELRAQLISGFQALAAASKQYDVVALLMNEQQDPAESRVGTTKIKARPPALPLPASLSVPPARLPQLPCVRRYQEGWIAVSSLALPILTNPEPAVLQIKSAWRSHPEALLPLFAGTLLDRWHPRNGPKLTSLLAAQAELFALAADSPSIIPTVPKRARFLAASTHLELARAGQTNSFARQACLENIRRAAASAAISAPECRAYFEMAFELQDLDLSRILLTEWERQAPSDPRAAHSRIQLEITAGAFGNALKMLDQVLADRPKDDWALEQRAVAWHRLKELLANFGAEISDR